MSEEPRVKVMDKRRFTPDGELREEYREGAEEAKSVATEAESPEPAAEPAPEEPTPPPATAEKPAAQEPGGELPGGPLGAPTVLDLISMLAEPAAVYLGDAPLPDGKSAEDPDLARFYIDLLDVLRSKTEGNLSEQEFSVLEDLIYRLRMRYVRKQK